ncbi:MAG: TlpA disulfide reductase family protein [Thermoactinomyces sp.]
MRGKLISAVIIIAVIGVIVFLGNGLKGKPAAETGDQAIDFKLQDVNGKTWRLSDFKGQPVVLNFFATWCQPCIDEAPELEAFAREYKDARLIIIARGEPRKRIENYIKKTDSKLLYLLDTKEIVSDEYGVVGQPETWIINRDGIIVERIAGPTTKKDLIRSIEQKSSS